MRIFGFISEQNGIGYYRMAEPLGMLEKQKKIQFVHNPFSPYERYKNFWVPHSVQQMNKTIKKLEGLFGPPGDISNPDLFLFQRYDNPFYFATTLGIKETYQRPIVQEVDDYVYDVPETNPGRRSYNEKSITDPVDPNDGIVWQRKSLGHFDAYIVTTPFLKEYYSKFSPTYICPNSIDMSKRKFPVRKPRRDGKIRLGFSASGGHQEGLDYIIPVLDILMAKYGNLEFHYYGGMFNRFNGKPYKNRVFRMKWAKLEDYPAYLHKMNFDIAIAPLVDRLFNRAKSNLRLLELWSSGRYPVVASRVGAYKDTIKDGVNGLLALERDEWVKKITILIEDTKLQKKLGEAGYQTVLKDYNLEKNAGIWRDAFRDIIKNYRYNPTRKDDGGDPSTLTASGF